MAQYETAFKRKVVKSFLAGDYVQPADAAILFVRGNAAVMQGRAVHNGACAYQP